MSARLRIGDDRHVGGNRRPNPLQGGPPRGAVGLEEREVRLDRRGERRGGLEQEREPLDPAHVRREARRQRPRVRVDAEAQDAADGRAPGREALEIGRAGPRVTARSSPRLAGREGAAGVGVGSGGSWSAGMNQSVATPRRAPRRSSAPAARPRSRSAPCR